MAVHVFFFFSSRRRHTRLQGDWSSDVCSSDLQCEVIGVAHVLEPSIVWIMKVARGESLRLLSDLESSLLLPCFKSACSASHEVGIFLGIFLVFPSGILWDERCFDRFV